MFSNYLHLFNFNFLILGVLIASFNSNVFSEDTGGNLQDERGFASLELISEPESAQVFINQEQKGLTPCILDSLRSGTYLITLKLDNYKQFSEEITLEKGIYKKLVIQLLKTTGTLNFISCPENACIVMNGDTIGKTPFTSEGIKPETYSISLSKKYYKTYQTTISVNEGKTDTISVKLEPLFSITKIFSTPDNAEIIINGASFGKTPFQCETLHPGNYKIIISKDGYRQKKITTEILNESQNIIDVRLISNEIADSLKQVRRKKYRNIRRLVFGSLTICFCVPSIIYSSKATKALEEEDEAWDDYMQLNLGASEYEKLYKIYTDKVNETNKIQNVRNSFFIATGLSCIGFVISIPF